LRWHLKSLDMNRAAKVRWRDGLLEGLGRSLNNPSEMIKTITDRISLSGRFLSVVMDPQLPRANLIVSQKTGAAHGNAA